MPPIPPRPDPESLARRNRRTAAGAGVLVCGMLGLSFAAVPLYDLFCRVTGFGGTVQTNSGAAPGAREQVVTIRFNAVTNPNLPWHFAPGQPPMQLHVGEEGVAFYVARNDAAVPVTGVATYNVTPEIAGKYFHKTACFCFEQQTLEPGQQVDMPLSFWVDPRMMDNPNTRRIRTITINYSFFRSLDDAARSGALASAGPHVGAAAQPTQR